MLLSQRLSDRSMRSMARFLRANDFGSVRVVEGAIGRACVASRPIATDEPFLSFTGPTQRHRGEWTIQVGRSEHITAADSEAPWLYMNHSFAPNVRLEQSSVDGRVTLTCRAIADLDTGDPVTFDYTLHEWELDYTFTCAETGRSVTGWVGRTEAEKDAAALNMAAPHIRSLHLQHLFGQESRC
jgi:hypothetical protein